MSSVKPKAHGLPNYDDIIKGAVRLLLLFFESLVTNLLSRSGMRMYRIDTTTRTPPMKDGLPKKLESKAHWAKTIGTAPLKFEHILQTHADAHLINYANPICLYYTHRDSHFP